MQLFAARAARVEGLGVRRLLPRRERRTVGAWCFLDHFGPTDPDADYRMTVGPHPHIGLQTVTWLLEGEAVHTDSLGSEQVLRPGGLNLMTAGRGIAHAEQTPVGSAGAMHGVQFWLAQPDSTRHGAPAFEHHAELPTVAIGGATATVMVGAFGGTVSPARADTDIVGVDLRLGPGTAELPLDPAHEHAVVPLDGPVELDGARVGADTICLLDPGAGSITVAAAASTRVFVLGGVPFGDRVLMWWNYVARERDEIDRATADWASGSERFGDVRSELDRIPGPDTPWS